jgi:hypothetical protein
MHQPLPRPAPRSRSQVELHSSGCDLEVLQRSRKEENGSETEAALRDIGKGEKPKSFLWTIAATVAARSSSTASTMCWSAATWLKSSPDVGVRTIDRTHQAKQQAKCPKRKQTCTRAPWLALVGAGRHT